MPGVSRTQRAEAKYNVTLDFPHLGLHSAASSGNLGLVTYALDHGQPVNSVVDGVLPLHVASSGGNDLIVRLLIDRGADVNAPRLPRKYSSDRHRDASAPIVGNSGATPLHFAAANGHENVVLTLLLHGAHPDRADKHGVTPEMLARQNGWTRCAELLSQWTHEKDKDLREREVLGTAPAPEPEPTSRLESLECKVIEKKIKVKRSIDNALHRVRPTLPNPPSSGQLQSDASYTTSPPPITESASADSSPETSASHESYARRPSLPHIFDPVPYTQTHSALPSKPSGRPSFSSSRRPRSAGTDAEPSASASASSTPGRLRGKLSLLHMFKKSTTGDSAASTPGLPATPDSRESLSGYASSSSAFTSASASPAPERAEPDRSRQSPLRARASESGLLSSAGGSPYLTTIPSSRSRLTSESASASTASAGSASGFPPLAVELHRKLSAERLRARSGSGSSSSGTTEARVVYPSSPPQYQQPLPNQAQLQGHRSPPVRPGILRPHQRSTSSSQSQPPPLVHSSTDGSGRSLRFDSSPSVQPVSKKRSGLNVKVCSSVSSLRGERRTAESPRSPRHPSVPIRPQESYQNVAAETPTRRKEYDVAADDDDEEDGYGEVISPRLGLGLALAGEGKSRLNELKTSARQRRPSAGSLVSHESSPLPSPTAPNSGSAFDCPFSINRPPPQPLPPDAMQSSGSQQSQAQSSEVDSRQNSRPNLLGIHGVDNRGRGDSIGSMSTSTEASASAPQTPLPAPGSSIGLGLQIRSPEATTLELPPSAIDLPVSVPSTETDADKDSKARSRTESSISATDVSRAVSPRLRAPPLDIDIRAISSHAQAEALVQRAQKSILEMEDIDIELPGLGLGSGNTSGGLGANGVGAASGRTPLSAKLAAYGESLAIERRFKEQEREREREMERLSGSAGGETPFGSPTTHSGRSADGRLKPRHSERALRKFSLEERPGEGRPPRRSKPRRPHTADGETQDASPGFLSPGHKTSLSSSALLNSHSSSSADETHSGRTIPTSSRTLPLISSPSPSLSPPRQIRSRTPDPASRYYLDASPPSHGSSSPFGVPLSRVSTAPPRHASPDIVPQRSMSDQERERQRARANNLKLMKMGIVAYDSFPRSGASSPFGHVRNGGGSGGSASAGGGSGVKARFGGIRGFVQTLTGKT
ncbi:hypothetical protein OH77DRAFT_737494 [Trametes cingulata]|nr:hypothetical protein OH77DRAFT_737494 [Trametes cingulata]